LKLSLSTTSKDYEMRGNITRRGKTSWRIKFDTEPDGVTGERRIRYVTIKGTRRHAEAELARLLDAAHRGILPDTSKLRVENYLRQWLDGICLRGRASNRDIIERQINPLLGKIELQRLKPIEVEAWLGGLRSRDGRKLHARTVRGAYRILHGALAEAVKLDMVARNVASAVTPPKVEAAEVVILDADQIAAVLDALKGSRLHPIAALAFATGMRRGELLALRWQNVDLGRATIRVEHSLEQTSTGLRFKSPKSKYGRRVISLPQSAVSTLSRHRKEQLEFRMALGMGKPEPDALVLCNHDGTPISPNSFSVTWALRSRGRACPM
jgi:integrase